MSSYDIWQQLSLRETQRRNISSDKLKAGAEETWISAIVYSVKKYLGGVFDALKPDMTNFDIALAERELIELVGELKVA